MSHKPMKFPTWMYHVSESEHYFCSTCKRCFPLTNISMSFFDCSTLARPIAATSPSVNRINQLHKSSSEHPGDTHHSRGKRGWKTPQCISCSYQNLQHSCSSVLQVQLHLSLDLIPDCYLVFIWRLSAVEREEKRGRGDAERYYLSAFLQLLMDGHDSGCTLRGPRPRHVIGYLISLIGLVSVSRPA